MEVLDEEFGTTNIDDDRALFNNQEMIDGLMTKGVSVLILVAAVITVGINLGVIIRVCKLYKKGELKPAFFFIGNLAVSDFFVGFYIVVSFSIDLTQFSMKWRNKCCGFLTAVVVTACQETICSIMLIAIDKYIYICHGISYRTIMTKKRVWICIGLSWAVSLLIGFLPAFGLHEDDWAVCNFLLYINKQFAAILFTTAVVIPLIIIISMYSIILSLAIKITLRKANEKENSSSSGATSISRLTSRSKSSGESSSTLSSRYSNSDSSGSSHKVLSPVRRKHLESKRKRLQQNKYLKSLNQVEVHPLEHTASKGVDSTTVSEDKVVMMPVVIELQETDITSTNEADSSEESDSTDNVDATSNLFVSKTGSYDLPKATTSKGSTTDVVCLKRITRCDKNGKVILNSSIKSNPNPSQIQFVSTLESTAEASSLHSDSEINSSESENEGSITIKDIFLRKRSYFKKVARETKDKVQFLQKCRAVKTIFLILLCFILTYVPFVTAALAFEVQKEKKTSLFKALNNFLYCAVILNSLLNPFVYAYGYKDFRIRTKRFRGIFAKEKKVRI